MEKIKKSWKTFLVMGVVMVALGAMTSRASAIHWTHGVYYGAQCCATPVCDPCMTTQRACPAFPSTWGICVNRASCYTVPWRAHRGLGILRAIFHPRRAWCGTCCSVPCCCYDPCCDPCCTAGTLVEGEVVVESDTPTLAEPKNSQEDQQEDVDLPGPNSGTMMLDESTGLISVSVPDDAKVIINGYETNLTGTERHFLSRGLKPGFTYSYEVRIELDRDGETLQDTQMVTLSAGQAESLAYRGSDSVKWIADNR